MANLYRVLGVDNNASDKEIKSAYRTLAKELHPDRNANNPKTTEKFKKVSEAYSVLSDPQKRQEYDQELRFTDGAGYGSAQGGFNRGSAGSGASMEDILRQFGSTQSTGKHRMFVNFSGSRAGSQSDFGSFQDILRTILQQEEHAGFANRQTYSSNYPMIPLTLNFEEAALGCMKNIRLADGRMIRVKFNAGVTNRQKVRLYLPDGNIVMAMVTVKDHKIFTRKNLDIYLTALIGNYDWGQDISIPTLYGPVTVKILPTYVNKNICLRGKGITLPDGRCGNQYVYIKKTS